VYIEAMDNYMKIIRRNAPVIMSQITMKELDKILPHDTFLRVHRSFIVNMHAIDCYVNRCISFRNSSATVPVGRKYLQQFNEIYKPHEHTHR
ncbi:MAG: LytTR family transcriptional regulator DNA-binding domain-containing protein, partial [Muribaculaceae bacterium]|nr:LytTR family transcriptional regulator DNA-binding domain-containing protein [Muribaculaceae bacterium]